MPMTDNFAAFAHSTIRFNCPISDPTFERIQEQLDLGPGTRVLDVGCGTGEWLRRLAQVPGVEAVGVDQDGLAIKEARRRAPSGASFHECSVEDFRTKDSSRFDRALCIGANHAFGGVEPMLHELQKWTLPGGLILVGDGFWKRTPDPEYLEFLGGDGLSANYAEHIVSMESTGLVSVWSREASQQEWDEFEWTHFRTAQTFAAAHPNDEEAQARLAKRLTWRNGYLKWGRSTMGFAYTLLRVPGRVVGG